MKSSSPFYQKNHVKSASWARSLRPSLVGRSGILTPAFQVMSSTTDAIPTSQGTLLALALSYGFNIGYTVMW